MAQPDSLEIRTLRVPFHVDVARVAPASPRALLVALHGWGQNAARFARPLAPLADRGVSVIAPQAPHPFYLDLATKKVGFSWLTVYERDRAVADLFGYLEAAIADAGAPPNAPVFLMGFSQGVSIATRYAVSGRVRPAGLIGCCADLPPDAADRLPDAGAFPVFLAYSPGDAIVPPEKTLEAAAAFEAQGFPVTRHPFAGGHRITPALVEALGAWMGERAPGLAD